MNKAKQSQLGITSFVLAMIPIAIILLMAIVHILEPLIEQLLESSYAGGCKGCGGTPESNGASYFLNILLLIGFTALTSLIGFILGITSLFEKKVKNTYGKIGLMICGIYLLVLIVCVIGVVFNNSSNDVFLIETTQ